MCCLVFSATASTYSQNTKLTLNLQNVTILDLMQNIESQSKFIFLYQVNDLNLNKKVNVDFKDANIEEILDASLKGEELVYEVFEKQILITKTERAVVPGVPPTQQPQQKGVAGTVKDSKGIPLPGVTVMIKGTTLGIVTDNDGNFRMSAPVDAKTLVFSFVGMKSQELTLSGKPNFTIVMVEEAVSMDDVVVVGYGTTKKETLTGAISSVKTDALLRSPNASIASTLAGQLTGLTSVASSGQPGKEDPAIYIRGLGSLSSGASQPLILVDGVERSFFQMDPNEIDNVTVLKDASSTAVFGVRGANGVVLVTTRHGEEGKAKISVTSSGGVQAPTREVGLADSYTFANVFNEMDQNDGKTTRTFSQYQLDRFRLGDEPIMYPNTNWVKALMKDYSVQTQHNVNISGGTKNARYFASVGMLYQNGLLKQLPGQRFDDNFSYKRYNYRTNLDIDFTPTTTLALGIGGIIADTQSPNTTFYAAYRSNPMAGPGLVDGKLVVSDASTFPGVTISNPLVNTFGKNTNRALDNTMNFDLSLKQKLDVITKGLSFEVKAANNTSYNFTKSRYGNNEILTPFYKSTLYNPGMLLTDPAFDKSLIYRIAGKDPQLNYQEANSKNRNWYFEANLRYNRKVGDHNFGTLVLYNQSKRYYPTQFPELPTAYIGLVGRQTYDYKLKYLAEFNVGYNGSENFAPGRRYGLFPAGSLGYVLTEERFMKDQKIINYLKIRGSIGLVGNDNIGTNRYLYYPGAYKIDLPATMVQDNGLSSGYNFGVNSPTVLMSTQEQRLGNPDVTWETSLKQNIGMDIAFFQSRLKITADVFQEKRKDILINRGTIPGYAGFTSLNLPVMNLGQVNNHGYEIEAKWNQTTNKLSYWITGNVSYARNKIIFQDEVTPNFPYMLRTGNSVGDNFGYVSTGFYKTTDFDASGKLVAGLPDPLLKVYPGDIKYKDLNNDGKITPDDVQKIGDSLIPVYTAGLNYGIEYKGFSLTMNWTGVTGRTVQINDDFKVPLQESRDLFQFYVDHRWTPETAETATLPRVSTVSRTNNNKGSAVWLRDGSYLKLKNATLGYSFSNQPVLKRLGISTLRITFTGYNLLTFDYLKILDPEGTPTFASTYPIIKIYNLGLNITF